MGRQEIHSSDIKIEQKDDILDHTAYDGDVVLVDEPLNKDWADALLFNEEPVTIRLEPSTDKHAAAAFPVWCNGKGCEVFQAGQWMEIGYLPVGRPLTIKRKYLEIIIRAKVDNIEADFIERMNQDPQNVVRRRTAAVHSFSVLEDRNPKGGAWLSEMLRRNM